MPDSTNAAEPACFHNPRQAFIETALSQLVSDTMAGAFGAYATQALSRVLAARWHTLECPS